MAFVIVALLAVAVAVFAMQNTTVVTVRFLVWSAEQMPLAAVVLISLGAGLVMAGVPLSFRLWRVRSRLRTAEAAALRARESAAPPASPPAR
jgi:uncharacterized integral membrane protein